MSSQSPDLRTEIRQHFEEIAPKYDWYKKRRATYHQALKSLAREVFPNAQELALLDVGCGTGEILALLAPRRGVGLDFTLGMVREARRKFGALGYEFVQAEGERIPLRDNADFDGMLCFDTIEHFHDWQAALAEMTRVARPGAPMLLSWANPRWEPLLHLLERLGMKMPEGPHRWPGADEVLREADRLGLTVRQQGWRLLVPAALGPLSEWVNARFHHSPLLREWGLIQYLVLVKPTTPSSTATPPTARPSTP